jgi:hypothetical protein
MFTNDLQSLVRVPGLQHAIACTRQHFTSHFTNEGFILHQKNGTAWVT